MSEEELLSIVATICEAYPRDALNNDIARGISFAVGYLNATLEADQ